MIIRFSMQALSEYLFGCAYDKKYILFIYLLIHIYTVWTLLAIRPFVIMTCDDFVI